MGLEYRAQLEQKALRDLHRSFYIFATVIVFFAVLGFLFIVWYYNALAFTSNNTSSSDLSVSNTSAIKFGVHSARLLTYPNSPLGVVTQQNKGISRLMDYNNKVVWLFGESYINISTQGGFATTLKHNTVMLMDTNNTVAPVVYTDLLSSDNGVSSVVSIGASVYIFYSRQSNIYGIGKLSFSNNDTTILSMVEDNSDIGPIMSTLTPTHVLLYCQEDQLQVYWIPRPTFEEAVHNKQFWSYFKSLRSSPNRPFTFDALHDGGRKVEIYSVGHIFHSMEWNEYWLQFVVLSTLDNHLYVWHSKDEYGPFTSRLLLEIHPTIGGITQAHFHKELWRGGGKIMVLSYTYCTKGIGGSLSHLVEVEIVL